MEKGSKSFYDTKGDNSFMLVFGMCGGGGGVWHKYNISFAK
jgi:hypothetical protein